MNSQKKCNIVYPYVSFYILQHKDFEDALISCFVLTYTLTSFGKICVLVYFTELSQYASFFNIKNTDQQKNIYDFFFTMRFEFLVSLCSLTS